MSWAAEEFATVDLGDNRLGRLRFELRQPAYCKVLRTSERTTRI